MVEICTLFFKRTCERGNRLGKFAAPAAEVNVIIGDADDDNDDNDNNERNNDDCLGCCDSIQN